MSDLAITVRGLRKRYGNLEAVRGIDLDVPTGQVLAFLGPNGAGKTTTVEILEGYRRRDGGQVNVLGHDPANPTRAWRARIGVVLQASRLAERLTVRETVEQYAGYYPSPRSVDETLDLVGLADAAGQRVGRLSGGQRRRLDVAVALVGDPELLFLDEPTTGFDPSARRTAWQVIAGLRELGRTIFLTTHYMDEAQELADRVVIITDGRIVADGAPDELPGAKPGVRVSFALPEGLGPADLPGGLGGTPVVANGRVQLDTEAPVADLHTLTGWALERGVDLAGLEVRRESLEEVYLGLTEADTEADTGAGTEAATEGAE